MRTYIYIAIDSRGQRVNGQLQASDPDSVVSALTVQGLRIESVQIALPGHASSGMSQPENTAQPEKLSPVETREVGRHIAEIVSAGVPLEAGLAAVAEEFPGGRVRRELRAIARDLEAGNDLESVLATRGTSGYLPALMRAGARSGKTGEILESFIAGTQVVSDLRQTFWMALAYPLILLGVLSAVGLFLLSIVVPQFGAIFNGFEIRLPWLTSAILAASRFLVEHGLWSLTIAILAFVTIFLTVRLSLKNVAALRLIYKIPFIGFLLRWSALARFAPVLSLLIEARVPLDAAIILAGDASGDVVIRDDCRSLADSVRAGNTLESASCEKGRFTGSFIRAMNWESHQDGFPEVLRSMADMYAGRARAFVALLVAVLPVLVVLFVALTVGVVVIALFMPLIELLNKLS